MKPIHKLVKDVTLCGGVVLGGDFRPDDTGCAFALGELRVIASNGADWDHVSVSLVDRVPEYTEMKRIRTLCFEAHEWVYELHAPQKKHVNFHPNVLHMWRPQKLEIPIPPQILV